MKVCILMSSNEVTSARGSHSDGTYNENKAFVFDHWCTTSIGNTFDTVTTNYKKLKLSTQSDGTECENPHDTCDPSGVSNTG